MSIMAKQESNFTPHPIGQFVGVCCDVVDLGLRKSEWNGNVTMKHKVRIVFQTAEKMKLNDGREFPATVSQMFTLSLSDKGNLRPFLESWMGRKLSKDAINNGIDLEELIGHNGLITVEHSDDGQYANILSIAPLPAAMHNAKLRIKSDYVRVKDRPPKEGQKPTGTAPKVAENPRITDALNQERDAVKPARTVGGDFDAFPEALEDQPDDLPF